MAFVQDILKKIYDTFRLSELAFFEFKFPFQQIKRII